MWPYPKMPTVRGQVPCPGVLRGPIALLHRGIGFTQQVHQGQKHAEGVFSHCVPVAFGAVEDLGSPGKGGCQIDVFKTRLQSGR